MTIEETGSYRRGEGHDRTKERLMTQPSMNFRGKNIPDMDKAELIEVIEYLAAEMQAYKASSEKLGDFANEVFLSMKPHQGRKYIDKWMEAHK